MEDHVEQEFSAEERTWAAFCHLAALFIFVLPGLGGVLGPLIVWLIKRDRHVLVDDQGKEAINFQITLIVSIAVVVLMALALTLSELIRTVRMGADPSLFLVIILLGFAASLGVLVLLNIILIIVASISAKSGNRYRYPIAIRFVR